MNKHLQTLILAHIIHHVLIHRTSILRGNIIQSQHHRLLVLSNQLCLTRVGLTRDSWRKNIVDWHTIGVLLNIHSLNIERTRTGVWIIDIKLIIRHILV